MPPRRQMSITAASFGFPPDSQDSSQRSTDDRWPRDTCRAEPSLEGKIVHVADVLADPEYAMSETQQRNGFRTAARRRRSCAKDMPIGAIIVCTRNEVEPFTDKQIELLHHLRRSSGDRDRERAAVR